MQERPSRSLWLAGIALVSGLGLVALVGLSLVRTVEQGRERTALDAQHRAHDLAMALRAALAAPTVLAAIPDAERFVVRDGAVVVPTAIGWLVPFPPHPPDPVVTERLRLAQVAEFAQHDAAASARAFDALLAPPGPSGDAALPVLLAAAWQARRAHDDAREHMLATRLDARIAVLTPADLADPTLAEVTAGAALFAAPRLPAWTAHLVPALPATLASPTVARQRELGAEVTALATATDDVGHRRRRLARAQELLPTFLAGQPPRADGDAVLLWFPDAEPAGCGQGALASPQFLAHLPGHGAVPDAPGLVFAPPADDHDDVVPGLAWVVPAAPAVPPWFAGPTAIVAATLALVGVFAGSLGLGIRGLRRERAALRARSEFLTGVTHELKTPIASIRLIADVLADDDVPPARQRDYFALLAGETARLSMLVDNVLDLGQIERGERAYDLRPCDLAAVVRDAVRVFAPLAAQVGMSLETPTGRAAAPAVADQNAVRQALLAVFENARKYAATGQRLEVATACGHGTFTLDVRDHGPGVPAAERDLVFQRFTRGTRHRSGTVPGIGLGLFLARAIVQRHGGDLVCTDPADGGPGAVFRFTFPLAEDHGP